MRYHIPRWFELSSNSTHGFKYIILGLANALFSFYKSKSAVIALEKARLGASAESSSSKQNQQRPSNIVRSSALNSSRNQAAGTSTATPEHDCDDFGQDVGDDEGNIDEPRPTAEYVASYSKHSNEKNKENRPISGRGNPPTIKKPSLMDPHPDAVRHRWESQHEESSEQQPVGPSKRKRPTRDDEIEENEENQESEESEDQGFFETDDRLHGSKRRVTQQTAPQRDPGPVRHPHAKKKRAVSHDEESATESERRNRAKPESILQSSARGQPADLEDDEDSSDDEPPNSTQVGLAAMTATHRAKRPNRQTQTRSLWSQNDSDQLVDLIENYGCSWAEIQKIAEFERGEVGQVALKDRARNLKVNFLK